MSMSSGIKLVDEDDEKILKLLGQNYKEDRELDINSIFYPERRGQQQRDYERFFYLLFYNNIFWIDSLWYLKDFFEQRQGVYLLKTVLYHKCGYAQYLDINIQPTIGKVSEDVEIFTRPTFYLKSTSLHEVFYNRNLQSYETRINADNYSGANKRLSEIIQNLDVNMDEIECKKKIMRENKICFSKNLIHFIQIFKKFIDYVYEEAKKECVCRKIHLSLCTCNKVRNINDKTVHFLHNDLYKIFLD